MDEKNETKEITWDAMTDQQLREGVRLCVERQDLLDRDVAVAVLEALNLTPEAVLDAVERGIDVVAENGGEPIFF